MQIIIVSLFVFVVVVIFICTAEWFAYLNGDVEILIVRPSATSLIYLFILTFDQKLVFHLNYKKLWIHKKK